jgi:type IV pilus assembly protein PilM
MKFFSNIRSFFSDITNFFQSASVLGIDMGTSSIKVVELSRKDGRFVLNNYGFLETRDYLEHANLALQMGSLDIIESEAAKLLKIILRDTQIKSRVALVSVPEFASFTTLLDMPLLSHKETSQSVEFQAKKYIPMPVEQVQVDWQKVDEFQTNDGQKFQRVMLIGIPKKLIRSYKNICQEAGLKMISMEIESMAVIRALPKFERPTLVIDIGAESTAAIVTEKGFVKYSDQIDYGGIHITRALSASLDLGMQRAEELKRRRGLSDQTGESELSTLALPFLNVIIQEVDYIRDNYERRYGKEVKQMALIGGGANLSGMEKTFSLQLGIDLVSPNIFGDVSYPPEIEPAIKGLGNELPVSFGVAKKYFIN